MDAQVESAIIGALMGSGVSGLITYFTSIKQFHSQRWWELKVESYQRIIDALYKAKDVANSLLAEATGNTKLTDDQEKHLSEVARRANEEILRAIDIGTFIISDESVERLKKYSSASGEAWEKINDSISWYDYREIDLKLTGECLKDLMILAKRDLKR